MPAFLLGMGFAIIIFEYKYVEKLSDGTNPFHKKFLDNLRTKRNYKIVLYTVGVSLILLPILLLFWDVACVDKS